MDPRFPVDPYSGFGSPLSDLVTRAGIWPPDTENVSGTPFRMGRVFLKPLTPCQEMNPGFLVSPCHLWVTGPSGWNVGLVTRSPGDVTRVSIWRIRERSLGPRNWRGVTRFWSPRFGIRLRKEP
jgi:hypothetical protein